MNCKPGDLAVFVRSAAGNEGRIVTCLRLATERELEANNYRRGGEVWVTDTEVRTIYGYLLAFATDQNLRPIRDPGDEAKDESLAWLPPLPTQTRETV